MREKLTAQLSFSITSAKSFAEATKFLKQSRNEFELALLDYNLPDAPDGEVIDLVLAHDIPVIVFTGKISKEIRKKVWGKRVIDYVLKDNIQNINYIISLIRRIQKNKTIKVLVTEDSYTQRKITSDYLKTHQYQVFTANNGKEALELFKEHPDIKIVITDYDMPEINGFELIKQLRRKYDKHQLIIIGMSSTGEFSLSSEFLKRGANDFITKPFLAEEFYCRINQNLEIIEQLDALGKSEDRFRTIIEKNPAGLCIISEQGLFEYANPSFCEIFGYAREELKRQPFSIIFPQDQQHERLELHSWFMAGQTEIQGEFQQKKKNGELLTVYSDSSIITGTDGTPKRLNFVLDITERKKWKIP